MMTNFYLIAIITILIAGGTAWANYHRDKNDDPKTAMILFGLSLSGIALALIPGWSAQKSAIRSDSIAKIKDSLYEQQLSNNLDSSRKIIRKMDSSLIKASMIIDSTNKVLEQQKVAAIMLTNQLKKSVEIQHLVSTTSRNLSQNLKRQSNDIENRLTGGDAFPKVDFAALGFRRFTLKLINEETYALPMVGLKVYNYSKLLGCKLEMINGRAVFDKKCVTENKLTIGSAPVNGGANPMELQGSEEFIDSSGLAGKIMMVIGLPKNTYVYQIMYRIVSEEKVKMAYRVLKFQSGKLEMIYCNDPNLNKPSDWSIDFPHDLLEEKYF